MSTAPTAGPSRQRRELYVLLVLCLVLAPLIAVASVGGYGLSIWVYQMLAGPPSAPHAAPISVRTQASDVADEQEKP